MTIDFSAGLYKIIHEHIGPYMTRQDFPGLYRILEYCKGLNWTTQIKTELNLKLQNDTGVHRNLKRIMNHYKRLKLTNQDYTRLYRNILGYTGFNRTMQYCSRLYRAI